MTKAANVVLLFLLSTLLFASSSVTVAATNFTDESPTTTDSDSWPYFDVDCNNECTHGSGTFCGIDGQCHEYSCTNWYQYGPTRFVFDNEDDNNNNDKDETTTSTTSTTTASEHFYCYDIPLTTPGSSYGDDVFYASVSFRCRSLTPSPIAMGFNRKCTTTPTDPRIPTTMTNSAFTCYELADNTDFGPFLETVEADTMYNCTDDEYDETGYPQFTYNVVYQSTIRHQTIGAFVPGFNGTAEFDPILAVTGAMYAIYVEADTDSPTASPTTSPPTAMPTSSSASYYFPSSHSMKQWALISAIGIMLTQFW